MRTLATLLLSAALFVGGLTGCGAAAPQDDAGAGSPSASPAGSEQPEASPSSGDQASAGNPLASAAEREAKKQGEAQKIPPRAGLVLGGDISYPNCPKGLGIPERKTLDNPMPKPEAEFVVIGLTNGPAYFPNPCLAEQVEWAKQRKMMVAAYSVLSFPDKRQLAEYADDGPYDDSTRLGRLRNAGHAQALLNMASMRETGLETPIVWLDIEPVSDWNWTAETGANFAVIQGAINGYRDAGYRVGLYSVPRYWDEFTGGRPLGLPEWRSAGDTSRALALSRCRDPQASLQGGQPVLAQWWDAKRDYNVTCPGVARNLGQWFHRY